MPTQPFAPSIRSLVMRNYRGIRNCTVDFAPGSTVLIGTNGAGKTAVLDCLDILFQALYAAVSDDIVMTRLRGGSSKGWVSSFASSTDISEGRDHMECVLTFEVRWP